MNNSMEIRGLSSEKVWDYENGYYWFSDLSRLNKSLAHYELYKMIVDKPGHIMELGVYKVASLIRFLTYRNCLESDVSRKIIGLDMFGKFPEDKLTLEADKSFIERFEQAGGDGLSVAEANTILKGKGFTNFELIPGNVFDTIPEYLEKNPQLKLSILHLDMDVKEPTEYALEMLFSKIVPGGLIVIDDYNAVAGATDAIDKFVKDHKLVINKMPFYSVPSYIVVK